MRGTTRGKLLQAAELILLEQGVHALTVRRVGEISGMNPALITYHFGGVSGLLDELLKLNISPMQESWAKLDDLPRIDYTTSQTIDDVLEIWLSPLLAPPAFNEHGRALVVMDEIASHGDEESSVRIVEHMAGVAVRVGEILLPHLPHLDMIELRLRIRFISGAALGPPPRVRIANEVEPAMRTPITLTDLLRFARSALDS